LYFYMFFCITSLCISRMTYAQQSGPPVSSQKESRGTNEDAIQASSGKSEAIKYISNTYEPKSGLVPPLYVFGAGIGGQALGMAAGVAAGTLFGACVGLLILPYGEKAFGPAIKASIMNPLTWSVTMVFSGILSIASTTYIGGKGGWRTSLAGQIIAGSIGTLISLIWGLAYMGLDIELAMEKVWDEGYDWTAVFPFLVSPLIITPLAETTSYLITREPKYGHLKRVEQARYSRVSYHPPFVYAMKPVQGSSRTIPAISIGVLVF